MKRFAILISLLFAVTSANAAQPAATGTGQATTDPAAPSSAATAPQTPTQRDWLKNLVEGLGWGFGLPDEPADEDYLAIVQGHRQLRIEAEQALLPGEPASTKNYHNFGPYSGPGWVSGISSPVSARLGFLLPLGGTYEVRAALRLPGHAMTIGGKRFEVDGGEHFSTLNLGKVNLAAGPQEIVLELPPDGGVDFIEFTAPDRPRIEPLGGWQLDAPLTVEVLATTTIRMLELLEDLPPHGKDIRYEAERSPLPDSVKRTDVRHLGAPSAGSWVRAGAAGTSFEMEFTPRHGGAYRLAVRGVADRPVQARLDGSHPFSFAFPPYLATVPAGTVWLDPTPHSFRFDLPARAGIDAIIISPLASSAEDFINLSGLRSLGNQVRFADIDRLISLLALLAGPR